MLRTSLPHSTLQALSSSSSPTPPCPPSSLHHKADAPRFAEGHANPRLPPHPAPLPLHTHTICPSSVTAHRDALSSSRSHSFVVLLRTHPPPRHRDGALWRGGVVSLSLEAISALHTHHPNTRLSGNDTSLSSVIISAPLHNAPPHDPISTGRIVPRKRRHFRIELHPLS